ncbi:MAG: GntR family transcriptional regulator [Clostridiales bacterium]|nr:GntR family transcriptional regulator [Clostridiales bacterium]
MAQAYEFDMGAPVYLQLMELIRQKIISAQWEAGQRVPAVRELALEFGVNPNTMQRALGELERDGLMYSERTAGRFVTQDRERIGSMREQEAEKHLQYAREKLHGLGMTDAQILERMQRWLETE